MASSNSPKRMEHCTTGNGIMAGTGNNGAATWMAKSSSEQTKLRYQEQSRDAHDPGHHDMDLPDPPLEYCETPRRSANETNGDLKQRGILSSIFDKVRSKDEAGSRKTVDCLPFSKDENRKSQPLLDNLLLDCAGGFRSSRDAEGKKTPHDSGDSMVQKPYEPPALGKSSRITPVGGAEENLATSQSHINTSLEPDAVEVLSVIRYDKYKQFPISLK